MSIVRNELGWGSSVFIGSSRLYSWLHSLLHVSNISFTVPFTAIAMDIVPPPMGSTSTNPSSILEGEDDDESLFAVVGQQKKGTGITAISTSGYDSSEATSTNEAGNILR